MFLVKAKSHTGCEHSESADELAEAGRVSEKPVVYDGPQKYCSLHNQIQPFMCSAVAEERISRCWMQAMTGISCGSALA